MSEWRQATLGNFVQLQRGHDLTETERSKGKVPVIGSAGQNGWHGVARCKGPGVTIGRSGASVGVITYVAEDYWPHNTVLYVTNFFGNDPLFAAFMLKTLPLAELNSGSAQPSLNRNFLYNVPVLIPPPETQRRIASILGAYDDLIEVNRRRIAVLEEMTRGLFEEWFVRFRFPGHEAAMKEDTPNGPLPKGWSWGRFDDLASEVRDTILPQAVDPTTPYIGLEHISRRSTTLAEHGLAADASSLKARFRRGDILFGKIRPYFHKVAWAPFDGVASTDAIVWRPVRGLAAQALLQASSDAFVAHSVQTSNGTKMPRANNKVLAAYPCALAPSHISDRFESAVLPMIESAASFQAANSLLAASRDLLLPRLMSGQLSVAQAERELEAA